MAQVAVGRRVNTVANVRAGAVYAGLTFAPKAAGRGSDRTPVLLVGSDLAGTVRDMFQQAGRAVDPANVEPVQLRCRVPEGSQLFRGAGSHRPKVCGDVLEVALGCAALIRVCGLSAPRSLTMAQLRCGFAHAPILADSLSWRTGGPAPFGRVVVRSLLSRRALPATCSVEWIQFLQRVLSIECSGPSAARLRCGGRLIAVRRQTGSTKWKSRIGGAALTGLGWATGWAPVAVVIGLIVDPDGSMDEMWVAIGGYPGFLCGVVFSVLIQNSKGRDRIGESSITRVGSVGAISGVLVIALPSVLVAGGDSGAISGPLPASVLFGSVVLLSALSGIASRSVARSACCKTASQELRT